MLVKSISHDALFSFNLSTKSFLYFKTRVYNFLLKILLNIVYLVWPRYFIKLNYLKIIEILKIFETTIYEKTKTLRLFFSKYFYSGLGYKMYDAFKKLFVWVGLTHYTILDIPEDVKIYSRKKRVYIVSYKLDELKNFLSLIRKIKRRDIYKGKGLLEIKTYKNFIKMKTGKRKQYN